MTHEEAWFMFAELNIKQNERRRKIIDHFKDPENIFKAKEKDLRGSKLISEKEIGMILNIDKIDKCKKIQKLKSSGINFVFNDHELFPERLKSIPDAPLYFFYKGTLPDPSEYMVAMVGSRTCSGYASQISFETAKNLALNGVQIISGLARGIDSASLKGALSVKGRTYSVLGCGIDIVYPFENMSLYLDMIDQGGGIISEYLPGEKPLSWHFPQRNRLISALSDKVLIMEAGERSGTLITAKHALDQGIDIYALPGRITDRLSVNCNRLIADGAGIFLDKKNFLEDLFSKPVRLIKDKKTYQRNMIVSEQVKCDFEPEAELILNALSFGPLEKEMLIYKTGLSTEVLSNLLMRLVIEGVINEISKDIYIRTC